MRFQYVCSFRGDLIAHKHTVIQIAKFWEIDNPPGGLVV